MGYRSNVKIMFSARTKDEMDQFIARMKLEEKITDDMLSWGTEEYLGDGNGWLISFEDVKWYEDFDEVIAWVSLMRQTDEAVTGISCSYARTGEEAADVEETTFGEQDFDHRLYISRNIEVNF